MLSYAMSLIPMRPLEAAKLSGLILNHNCVIVTFMSDTVMLFAADVFSQCTSM